MKQLKVLVGCECSGIVRDEFRRLGHDAWSADFKPCERSNEFHYQCDVHEVLGLGWDIGIFHPDCDYLTVSGNRWFKDDAKAAPGILVGAERRAARDKAVEFVKLLWSSPIPRIAIENPIGRLSTLWMKPTQIVEPFHFGDPFKKATCLWLKNLPPLTHTQDLGSGEQACWKMPPGKNRKTDRARTYPGFARAMAEQWSRAAQEPPLDAREIYKTTSKDRSWVRRLRKLGASNFEIAKALGISEDAPVLQE